MDIIVLGFFVTILVDFIVLGFFVTMLDYKDRWAGQTLYISERKFLFRELLRKSRDHVLGVIRFYDILPRPEFENYYRVINILIDNMKNPIGAKLWKEKFGERRIV